MDTPATSTSRSDEKIWAALAHYSALLFGLGSLISLVILATQRRKSSFASFHALQAMSYQVLAWWLWILITPVLVIVLSVVMVLLAAVSAGSGDEGMVFALGIQVAIWGSFLGSFALYVLLGLLGAGFCLGGREFRYPLIGKWLARFLGYEPEGGLPLKEAQEDRVVASVAHGSAIITLWGLIFPLVAWISQKDRSAFLRFQSLQALLYQGVGALAYLGTMALYFVFSFGVMLLMFADPSVAESPDAFMLAFMIPVFLIMFVFFVLGPIYMFFAFLASVRILRGHDYRYPVLGSLLARRMAGAAPTAPEVA